jgi:predicted nucleic acid-binding protein
MSLPVVVFDTSALSFLIKNPRSEPHLKAMTCGFDVWLTAMSVDEIIATPVPETRETLRAGLQRLLASGRCVGHRTRS